MENADIQCSITEMGILLGSFPYESYCSLLEL